jgi:hypothetical protein
MFGILSEEGLESIHLLINKMLADFAPAMMDSEM